MVGDSASRPGPESPAPLCPCGEREHALSWRESGRAGLLLRVRASGRASRRGVTPGQVPGTPASAVAMGAGEPVLIVNVTFRRCSTTPLLLTFRIYLYFVEINPMCAFLEISLKLTPELVNLLLAEACFLSTEALCFI